MEQITMGEELREALGEERVAPQRLTVLHVGDVFLDGPIRRLRRDTKERRREELREAFRAFLSRAEEEGADAVLFSGNLIKHPCFNQMREAGEGYRVVGGLDNTDRIMRDTFWVGVYPGMTDEMIDYMAKTIIEALD